MSDIEKQAKDALLAGVNKEVSWIKANRTWIAAVAVALVVGFILGHVL